MHERGLSFGTLAHAQFASMVLCHVVRHEQQRNAAGAAGAASDSTSSGNRSSESVKFMRSLPFQGSKLSELSAHSF
jgi:hypothetical protein